MGWMYTARDSPRFQHNSGKPDECSPSAQCQHPPRRCRAPSCTRCCRAPSCSRPCPHPKRPRSASSTSSCCKHSPDRDDSSETDEPAVRIRIIRHKGQYSISTKPSTENNAPFGPNPLKYFLDVDDKAPAGKLSIEAKYNDCNFDYTCSKTSFVLDFMPPGQPCLRRDEAPSTPANSKKVCIAKCAKQKTKS
ncbi:Uncharacterized protein OBRU01_03489 [Operophtera brumata]|uniref:Uncharacterized protein n=1 Tax=Operophtera brumata TaxID=104452 RepID=A0A0L7LQN5_OPEBR|nr:Uncharacterized protein OBRU01_03489 [Operophtera brumata]